MRAILRKMGLMLIGAALLAGTLTACATPASTETQTPTSTSITVTDDFNRTVTIKKYPQRIISLSPAHTEILFALGLSDRIVGVTDYSDYPPEALTKPNIGAYDAPDIEKIVAMEPDLVLSTTEQQGALTTQLESRGIIVVGLSPKTISEVLSTITLIGKITGQDKEAATLVADMQQRIDAITAKTSQLTEAQRLRVFYIFWQDPIWTAGAGTFEDALIEMAGGVNVAHSLNGYVTMSLEAILDANPQVFIAGVGMGTGEDLPLQYVKTEDRLKDTDARLNNRIYGVDMNIIGRPGPRIVDALEELFGLIHPELK